MQIFRTFNEKFIYDCAIATWDVAADDGAPDRELFYPPIVDSYYWLKASEEDKELGVFLFNPHNLVCYEGHSMLLGAARGKGAECGAAAIDWMFNNTPCQRIIVNVPVFVATFTLSILKGVGLVELSFS